MCALHTRSNCFIMYTSRDLFSQMTSSCPERSCTGVSSFVYVCKAFIFLANKRDIVPWQKTRWWRGQRWKVGSPGAFLRGGCPEFSRCSGFPHPKDMQMRQTGNCKLAISEIWVCLSLRDPAINWQLGVTLPLTQGSCGGFQQPHHPECRRSGDRMKKEWMDGCQLITLNIKCFSATTMQLVYIVLSELRRFYYVYIVGAWNSPLNGGIMAIVVHDDFCNVIDSP